MPSKWINKTGYTDRKTGKYIPGRIDIYERDNDTCCYCGKHGIRYTKEAWKQNPLDVITLDHIVPQWEIAQTCESDAHFRCETKNPRNLVTVCNGCNSSKRHTPLYIWCTTKGYDYAVILERIADRIQRFIA